MEQGTYAIIDTAGNQVKVEAGSEFKVPRLSAEAGEKVVFDKVLFVSNNGTSTVGTPTVSGASVEATIVAHAKEKRLRIFKRKRRKGFKKTVGHRTEFTRIKIDAIKA
ncbi:MAG: 50S ribosomal protein L21 [Deltaproteobacteria bacterium]|nr:50S ribosomal protein L21 [Deltaproteobacteria bacterium]